MARGRLPEIEDRPWCPAPGRDAADLLRFSLYVGDSYAPAAALLAKALAAAHRVEGCG